MNSFKPIWSVGSAALAFLACVPCAAAYTAIKSFNGNFCSPDEQSGLPSFDNLQRGYAIKGDGSAAVCPVFSSEDLELDTITNVEVLLKFTSTTCANATHIKTCVVDHATGVSSCSSSFQTTTTDCNNPFTYSLTGASLLAAWSEAVTYPYIYVNAGNGVNVTISGYKVWK